MLDWDISDEQAAIIEWIKERVRADVKLTFAFGIMVSFHKGDNYARVVFNNGGRITLWGCFRRSGACVTFSIGDPDLFEKLGEVLCTSPLWDFRRAAIAE